MNPDLDTLVTALYVTVDDLLVAHPEWVPPRPTVGIAPELSDAELVSLAVLLVLLGFDSEARFVRYAKAHLTPWFPYVPQRPGYNKRLRRSGELIRHVMACLARDCPSWHDNVWLVDSTPIDCGPSRETNSALTWRDGPPTVTAPATPAGSGGCAYTCWPPRPACRPP